MTNTYLLWVLTDQSSIQIISDTIVAMNSLLQDQRQQMHQDPQNQWAACQHDCND